MKMFKLQITEEELTALIMHHTDQLRMHLNNFTPSKETAERIVDLTRRLNKDTPEIEGDPRPKEMLQNYNKPEPSEWGVT